MHHNIFILLIRQLISKWWKDILGFKKTPHNDLNINLSCVILTSLHQQQYYYKYINRFTISSSRPEISTFLKYCLSGIYKSWIERASRLTSRGSLRAMMVRGCPRLSVLLLPVLLARVAGHGMLVEPPSRSSMWRYGFDTEPNYTDNELYCGGVTVNLFFLNIAGFYLWGEDQANVTFLSTLRWRNVTSLHVKP